MQKVASPMLVFGIAFVACLLLVSPLLLAGRILAFGDGLIESYPAFVSPINFWDPNMLLGFPVFADPNFASFYPLRLLAYVPYGFNLYVMLAYAVAAASTFGYVYDVAHDRSAAVTAACSFTLGGFMVSHFGHPMIVGPTAWTITALWALQRYLSSKMTGWLAVVAVGFGISCTAGQPQITLFAIVLLTAYATTLSFSLRRPLRSLVPAAKSFVAIILGIGIGAVAIVPAVHLAVESSRSGLTFAQFVEDQLPLQHLARSIVFPFVAGGGSADLTGPLLDSAASPFTEVAPYIGIAALALAIACMLAPRNRIIIFWGVISVAGLALAAGDALPFAAWTYIIPPFNSFRIPGRHAYGSCPAEWCMNRAAS